MLKSFSLFLCFAGIILSFQNNIENLLSQTEKLQKKGEALTSLNPDSALYYYNKALSLIEPLEDKNELSLQLAEKKVDLFTQAGFIFQSQNKFFLASEYFKKALSSVKQIENDSLKAECLFNLAEINLENGKYSYALSLYSDALKIYQEIESIDGIFWSHIGIAIIYRECGNSNLSEKNYLAALKIGDESSDEYYKGIVNNNLGNLYTQSGNYSKALNCLMAALDNFKKTGHQKYISDCYESIGEFYLKYEDFTQALKYFNLSTEIVEKLSDNYRLFSRYANIAKTYIKLNQRDNAIIYFSKTLELVKTVGDKSRLSEILVIISDFFLKNKDYESSLPYLKQALDIAEQTGDSVSIALSNLELAKLHFEMRKYKISENYALTSKRISDEKNLLDLLKESTLLLAKLYELKNDYRAAFKNYEIYSNTKDSIINSDKIKIIENTRAKYNFEKLQNEKLTAENATLLADKEISDRNILIVVLSAFLIITFTFVIRYLVKKKKFEEAQNNKQLNLKRKIDLLQNQVDTKNRELASKAMMISQNNKLVVELSSAISNCLNGGAEERNELRKLKNMLDDSYQEKNWNDFMKHFEEVHPNFYKNLSEKYPDLTSGEMKICSFLKMNLNTKEISQITSQTTKSIEVARTRIRKKLNIDHSTNLNSAIQNL